MKRLEPLLETVKSAPMDQSFKSDASLLVTECLIRAIEARTAGAKKAPEAERLQAVQNSTAAGLHPDAHIFTKCCCGLRRTRPASAMRMATW